MAAEAPKMPRDGTMEVTAKEGMAYLEKEKPDLAETLKQQLKEDDPKPTNGAGDAPSTENGTAKVPRDNTMVQTAQEGKEFLEKEGGVNEDAKTRAQEKELNDSKDKEAMKRSADDDQSEETDEAKKQKVEEEENGDDEEKSKPEEQAAAAAEEEAKE